MISKENYIRGLLMAILIAVGVFVAGSVLYAQTDTVVTARRTELELQLKELEKEIDEQQGVLNEKQEESQSLQRDIDILNAKIKRSELSIKARDIAIRNLSEDIAGKTTLIGELQEKIDRERESIATLLREIDELDSYSLPEIILGGRNLGEFFEDLEPYLALKEALKESIARVSGDKEKTQDEKEVLEEKKEEQAALQAVQRLEKKRIEEERLRKKQILSVTKGLESLYKKMLSQSEQSAAKIRAELFTLRGGAAIPFEKALELATAAGNYTGVRPALILGLIAEESNLGENVGTGSWRVDMKAPRDTVPFEDITRRLGLNPDQMPVSKKPWYGYGGAMGPAQFLPSTWIQFEPRVAKATGHNPPNPWDPADAFMAAALYLDDAGAGKGTRAAERLAALRYLAGWTNATKKAYAFYGDDVMELAAKYQRQIDILQNS